MASEPSERDAELAGFVPLFALTLLGAAYETVRQTDAYLGPGLATARSTAVALLLLSLGLGLWLGRRALLRARRRSQLLGRLAAALSCVCSASGPLWFWAFEAPYALSVVGCALPLAIGLLAGATIGALLQGAGLAYRELGALGRVLGPLPLLLALVLALSAAVGLSHVGLWRAAAGVGLAIAMLALLLRRIGSYFSDHDAPSKGPPAVALAAGAASFALAQAFVPVSLVARYPAEVVWTQGDASDLVVISAQNTFQLFEAGQLRLSSADAYRLAESAVHPGLAASKRLEKVLLFGPAGGFLEREVLRYRSVRELVSVSERESARFRGSVWPRSDHGTLSDARLRLVVAEPLVWLQQHPQRFDCIVVSLPAPADYLEGKHYTRHFYQVLEQHLKAEGMLIVQAGSRASLPATFATIRETLASAGFVTRVYEAPVPLQGALSFVIATRSASFRFAPQGLPAGLRFLDAPALERSVVLGAPDTPRATISTLDQQRAVEAWHHEQTALGN